MRTICSSKMSYQTTQRNQLKTSFWATQRHWTRRWRRTGTHTIFVSWRLCPVSADTGSKDDSHRWFLLERSLAGPGTSEAATPWTGDRLVPNRQCVDYGSRRLRCITCELDRLDKKICRYLRALSKGRAYDSAATESHGRSWTNAQILQVEALPARAEIAIRRVKWWEAMTEHNHADMQTMAAIWETASRRGTNVDGRRFFLRQQRTHLRLLSLKTCTCLRGCLTRRIFSNSGRQSNSPWYPFFDDEDVRHFFQRTDFKLMRTAAFSNKTRGQYLASVGREPRVTFANCQETIEEVDWCSRVGKSSWRIKHTTRAATAASNPHCESQLSRINVSIAAVHLQTVPQCRTIHGPEVLAGQTAVT